MNIGDKVNITKGDWKGYSGKISSFNDNNAYVSVRIDSPPAIFEDDEVIVSVRRTTLTIVE